MLTVADGSLHEPAFATWLSKNRQVAVKADGWYVEL